MQRTAVVDVRRDTNYGRNCSIASGPGQPGITSEHRPDGLVIAARRKRRHARRF